MGLRPNLQTAVGIVLTVIGLVGMLVSFSIQKSDVDPTALTVAFASISVSIVGISLIIGDPTAKAVDKQPSST
ncbi:MAG TPA: hypothetical protein VEG61_02370 [Candidatus Dormibacteraeota bacterium]|jgi:hypothetical protein|nr:hypothetical protein [Candidatus Dormibacteraeota bacterium]